MANGLQGVTNFLVPATGSTNAYVIRETYSAAPYFVNFNNVELDGIPFRPSGVIADNTQGNGDLTIIINEIGFRIVVKAGEMVQMPYPAPINHTANILGDGLAVVVFVDYPVIPFVPSAPGNGNGGAVTVADGADAALGATTDTPVSSGTVGTLSSVVRGLASLIETIDARLHEPEMMTVTNAGSVTAGASMISIVNTGSAPGIVGGVNIAAGSGITFERSMGVIGELTYDATGTEFTIATLRGF